MSFLAVFRSVMVASASMPYAEYIHENPFYFLIRHGISIVVAAVVAFLTYRVSLNLWFKKCFSIMACDDGTAIGSVGRWFGSKRFTSLD